MPERLSHGTRYYRAHPEEEKARKRAERARLASAAMAYTERRADLLTAREQRWKLKLRKLPTGRHRWAMDQASEHNFRAFLRENNWAVPSRRARPTFGQFELLKRRKNFVIEALGYSPEDYDMLYGGR
jgi:hypothetical protein